MHYLYYVFYGARFGPFPQIKFLATPLDYLASFDTVKTLSTSQKSTKNHFSDK